jgi:hypothetical protein
LLDKVLPAEICKARQLAVVVVVELAVLELSRQLG